MASIEKLLEPISPDKVCGDDLSYDSALTDLEAYAKGKPEDPFNNKPAEEPDWKKLRDMALNTLDRSKDLRAGLVLCLALLKTEGIAGFSQGLTVLHGWLDKFWDTLYPRLDPDDKNDPTQRVNILRSLTTEVGGFQDPFRFVERLRAAPLCKSPSIGIITYADMMASRGDKSMAATPGKPIPTAAQIEAAFRDGAAELQPTLAAVQEARSNVKKIDEFIEAKVGAEQAISFEVLQQTLDAMAGALGGAAPAEGGDTATAVQAGGAGAGTAGGASFAGAVNTREDAVRALDAICDFYRRNEPSSPIPYILQRARKLVSMDFMEIVNELTPDALAQLKVITGHEFAPQGGEEGGSSGAEGGGGGEASGEQSA